MKNGTKLMAVLGLVMLAVTSFGQNLSNRGRDFWVGYGHHQQMESGQSNAQEMVLYLSSEQAANVTVTIEGTAWVRNYAVPANTVIISDVIPKAGTNDARLISLPCSFVPPGTPCGGEGIFTNKGIHITSDVPIVAYAHIYATTNSGASMLMPVETWGYAYTTLNSRQNYAANCFSWAYVIAKENNTVVEVIPSQTTRSGRPANVPYTVTLNRGEIYQLMAGPEAGTAKPELSGTKFKSIANASGECHPIAVFAGSSRTYNNATCGSGGGDNDNQQCFPTQAWGKRYLTAPTSNSTTPSTPMWNTYKIAVKDPTTNVYRNGTLLTGLIANAYYEFQSNEAEYITSDKPVMVGQYMTGGTTCQGGGGLGDPEMMYISPIEQGIKRIGFYRNDETNIQVNYLTLIIPTTGLASLTINGSSTFDHTYAHPRLAGYTVVIKRWTATKAQAVAQSDVPFTAITYGLGSQESYGYNAGTLINNLNAIGSIYNVSDTSTNTIEHDFTCNNTPLELSILLAYQPTRLVWQLSTLSAVLTPNADVIDNAPVAVGPPIMVDGIPYYKYTLPGTYQFSAPGTYTIPLLSTHPSIENCNNTEAVSFEVVVQSKPTAPVTYNHTGCIADAVQFNGPAASNNGYTLNQWEWTLPGGIVYNTQNPTHTFTTTGNQPVSLHLVTEEGCVMDTTFNIPITVKPVTTFGITPASICEDGMVTFSDTSSFSGSATVGNYYWDFGNGNIINTASNANQTETYPDPGIYTVKHAVSVSATCFSDTAVKTVRVWAKPNLPFTYPAGCLPAGGLVQFNSNAFASDGQTIVSHSWNFGDPNANAGNPNTSTLANPTHMYTTVGNYTIQYSATTANGCTTDTTVNASFNPPPTFAYPALSAVCENSPPVSVATASVTNGVPGSGIYNGPGTTSAGMFDPAVAGPGNHTIWYVFSATSGCTDSISQSITVNPAPEPFFAIPSAGCLDATGVVQFNYNGTAIAGQTYSWNFGDPNANAGNPNTSTAQDPTHIYQTGNYNITLQVNTPQGCTEDSVLVTTFNLKPSLSYPALASVCVSQAGTVSVASATVTNGVPGTGVYSGPATDAAGNFNPSAAGAGTHEITYIFTAQGNCIDSVKQTILVNPKPNASFEAPLTCLDASGVAQFTYNGSLSAGQTYSWNFNDPNANAGNPNTSTAQNPTHIFTNTGNYNVSVTVTDGNGCVDDSVRNLTLSVKPALDYPALPPVCESAGGTVNVATATVTNGVTGSGVYSGPGTNAAGIFDPAVAGSGVHTIKYIFTSTANCIDSITQTIAVSAKPTAAFSAPVVACLPTSGQVQFTYSGSTGSGETFAWDFDDPNATGGNPNTSTAQNPTHNYTNTGAYDVTLVVTNANGCTDTEIINYVFSVTPELSFPALPAVCETAPPFSVANATVTNNVTGTGVYSGPGVDASGNFDPRAAGPGTHTVTYTFTSTGNCVSTITSDITVNPSPRANFSVPAAACLPTNGQVQFTFNGSALAGQTYAWDFDDPNASGGNPNTSTAQNPTHNYTNTGSYDVLLTVTAANGCTHDTTITHVFSVTPELAFGALTSVCESVTGTVSVANASVLNNVTGSGVYSGPGTDAAGNFSPSSAGPGIHTITYTFTSSANCITTVTSDVVVHPKPTASIASSTDICADQQAQFSSSSTVPSGSITAWTWSFGDGAPVTYNNGDPFTHPYTAFGTYNAWLVTESDQGCLSDTARARVNVHAMPVTAFAPPASVCMPNGEAVFTNGSTAPDGAGLTYQWNYGDGGTSSGLNGSHVYAAIGNYPVTLTATSIHGCETSYSENFAAFYDKPVAQGNISPTTLCQGVENEFIDESYAPNSTIASRLWMFGDGTSSGAANYDKVYRSPGVYEVKLVVTSTEGCVSDTFRQNVTVYLQPIVDAGPSFVVPMGTQVQFRPVVNSTSLNFQWTPPVGLSSADDLDPTLVVTQDQEYRLTATGAGGCTASDIMYVKVLRPVKIPNAFSPNGDGVNDTWIIENLSDYPGAQVNVFNRYGQKVFTSNGYSVPWDGTTKGKPLPFATYYYVIELQNGFKPLSGSITIIR